MSEIKFENNSVDFPKGYEVYSVNCGLADKSRDDLTLIYSNVPAKCAIVFTKNQVKAAPVLWDQMITEDASDKQAIIINVKNANACTGIKGFENSEKTANLVSEMLDIKPSEVIVCSTGVIGEQLDFSKIENGIKLLEKEYKNKNIDGLKAASAILTTDTKIKTASAVFELDGKKIKIGAMCKGSGMIRPNMATMLSFVCTDCNIRQEVLQEALDLIVKDTYNMISVDGDMSTNDTALILANGLAENREITDLNSPEGKIFFKALLEIETELAKSIVKDGEGATKFVEVNISNAISKQDARTLARAVIESNLVKTAIFGEDANWGRIVSSLGASEAKFDPNKTILEINGLPIFKNGEIFTEFLDEIDKSFKDKEIIIDINCNLGSDRATGWGCDLSYDYVKINGDYRT